MDFAPRRRWVAVVLRLDVFSLASYKGSLQRCQSQKRCVDVPLTFERSDLNEIRPGLHESADVVKAKSCGARSSSMKLTLNGRESVLETPMVDLVVIQVETCSSFITYMMLPE